MSSTKNLIIFIIFFYLFKTIERIQSGINPNQRAKYHSIEIMENIEIETSQNDDTNQRPISSRVNIELSKILFMSFNNSILKKF
jgi:hypothetical protein